MIPDLSEVTAQELAPLLYNNQTFKLEIADNMEKYGGSFVKSLAEPIRRADKQNFTKLVIAFHEYFLDYQPKNWRRRGIDK